MKDAGLESLYAVEDTQGIKRVVVGRVPAEA